MKRILLVLSLLIPILWGCSDSVVNPIAENQTVNAPKSWINLPKNQEMSVEQEYYAANIIDGRKGGEVNLNINYKTSFSSHVKINAKIKVPKGAFSGYKIIMMNINNNNGTVSFYPSPATFDKPLVFDMVLEGVDLSGVDPNSLNFMYLAQDGTYEAVQYNNIEVNVDKGILEVDDAIIPHFSKYGWCR